MLKGTIDSMMEILKFLELKYMQRDPSILGRGATG
jgi:hypothetical protein